MFISGNSFLPGLLTLDKVRVPPLLYGGSLTLPRLRLIYQKKVDVLLRVFVIRNSSQEIEGKHESNRSPRVRPRVKSRL